MAWVCRAGKNGKAHRLFLDSKLVALGRQYVDDLGPLPADRKAFVEHVKALARAAGGPTTPSSLGHIAQTLFRFVHVMHEGDWVLYPATTVDGQVYFGRVGGPYRYGDKSDSEYPHQRAVVWLKSLPRSELPSGLFKEISAFHPFYEIKRNLKSIDRLLGNLAQNT